MAAAKIQGDALYILMNFELQRLVEAELTPGEKILWSGSPDPRHVMRQSFPMVAIIALASAASVVVCYALYLFGLLASDNVALNATIFYLLVGSLIASDVLCCFVVLRARYVGAEKTLYALTSERVVIVRSGKSNSVSSIGYDKVKDIKVSEEKEGKANVAITQRDTNCPGITLVGILDARTVEGLIRRYSGRQL